MWAGEGQMRLHEADAEEEGLAITVGVQVLESLRQFLRLAQQSFER